MIIKMIIKMMIITRLSWHDEAQELVDELFNGDQEEIVHVPMNIQQEEIVHVPMNIQQEENAHPPHGRIAHPTQSIRCVGVVSPISPKERDYHLRVRLTPMPSNGVGYFLSSTRNLINISMIHINFIPYITRPQMSGIPLAVLETDCKPSGA